MARPSFLSIVRANATLQAVLTLAIGASGALLAGAAGLPAAALIGSTIAVSAVSFCRLPTAVPGWLRNLAFTVIGCSLASSVSADLLELAFKWPVSLACLVVVMGTILLVSGRILTAFFGQDGETALLAASPGALSYSLALAAAGVGDARAIAVIQSIRLLTITTVLPLVLDLLELETGQGATAPGSITLGATIALFLLALLAGRVLDGKGLPAAYLIAGVLVSGLLHYLGLVSGRPQSGLLFAGFITTGAVVGSRFTTIPLADIRRLVAASLTVVLASSAMAALFAWLCARLLDLPFGQVWVSYAPGGVEAMAAMALALGYDSVFVATHHLFRILLLLLLLPVLMRLFRRGRRKRTPRE